MADTDDLDTRLLMQTTRYENALNRLVVCAEEFRKLADYGHGEGDDVRFDAWADALDGAITQAKSLLRPSSTERKES